MADTKTKAEDQSEREEKAAPTPQVTGVAATEPARVRIGSEPKRLSKGQRKHLRRQKQAGEIKVTHRR